MLSYSSTYAFASKIDPSRCFKDLEQAEAFDLREACLAVSGVSGDVLQSVIDLDETKAMQDIALAIEFLADLIRHRKSEKEMAEYRKRRDAYPHSIAAE